MCFFVLAEVEINFIMMIVCDIVTWFRDNNVWISAFSEFGTCVLGLAMLVVSIATLVFAGKQTKINQMLSQLHVIKEQPVFIVSTKSEQDSNDNSYGTEHLLVKKIGAPNVTPEIHVTVLFNLIKVQVGQKNSFPVIVEDYFNTASIGSSEEEIVYHTYRKGNKRLFYELYMEALQDKSENGVHYWFDEICLVCIDYTDLLHTSHTKYFINKEEVNESRYQEILSKAPSKGYCLKELNYQTVKNMFT